MINAKKPRGKRPAVQLFLRLREKGKILIEKLRKNEDAEKPRSDSEILREIGLSSFDLWKMRPYLIKFEAEISKGEFDRLEQDMFLPTAADYKALPFYQEDILGKAPKQKPKARKVSSRAGEVVPSPAAHSRPTPSTAPTPLAPKVAQIPISPILPTSTQLEPDVFAEFVKSQPTLDRAKIEASVSVMQPGNQPR